ncbi:MAG: PepSY domain-containing protein [Candidatus Lactobacillus pullistercoris]|uniref:PepSY domain-containing protein n=1 Tax=Candidatus Lactobacillus pullistercoris TaxID=2838636 RepID=A0A9E2KRY7_9LACO|nr:PepSY domain-containing protein [Candidatus Lactobacillus pullistercoris]
MKKTIIITSTLLLGFLLGAGSTYFYYQKVSPNAVTNKTNNKVINSENVDYPKKKDLPQIHLSQNEAIASFKKLYSSAQISSISLKVIHDHYVYDIAGFDKNKDCTIKIDAANGKIISQATTRYEYSNDELTALDLKKIISQNSATKIAKRRTNSDQAISWQLTNDSKYDFPIWKVTTLESNGSCATIINALNGEIIE